MIALPADTPSRVAVIVAVPADAVETMQKALSQVPEQGGEILYGGKVIDRPGFWVEPTLVAAHGEMKIISEETFAPILYVFEFEELALIFHEQRFHRFDLRRQADRGGKGRPFFDQDDAESIRAD